MGVLMVNAYVAYVKYNLMQGKKKSYLLSHYEFWRAIALAWLDPDQFDVKSMVVQTPSVASK
jgi:hypothetical protein